jgi:hypothetical protein
MQASQAQIKFVTDFWVQRLGQNPKVTKDLLISFRKALEGIIIAIGPTAVCANIQPAATLQKAMKIANVTDMLPLSDSGTEVIILKNGMVKIWENNQWKYVTPR